MASINSSGNIPIATVTMELAEERAQDAPPKVDTLSLDNSDSDSTSPIVSVTRNISRVRLTIEEIIANDNDASRVSYLPTTPSVKNSSPLSLSLSDDNISVSSSLESDKGSIASFSTGGCSGLDSSSIVSSFVLNDPFKGVDDEEFSNLDRYGFKLEKDQTDAFLRLERAKLAAEKEKEAARALKWISMLKALEKEPDTNKWPETHKKFASRLFKGVPDCLRTKVWGSLLETRGLYVAQPELKLADGEMFASLYLKVSGFERQIDLDIERTLRDHVLFKIRYSQAQISLFKILVAYSNLDPEVGYCQGMSTIAAFLLLYFDEAGAFEAFVKVMARDDLRLMYRTGFPLLFEYFWIQERLMKKFLPALWTHLERHTITTSIYATKWYLTLFLSFPTRLAARIWDLLLFYGLDILPLTALALLKLHEKRICTLGFEETMQFLGRIADAPTCSNPDELMRIISQLTEKYYGSGTAALTRHNCHAFRKYRREYATAAAIKQ